MIDLIKSKLKDNGELLIFFTFLILHLVPFFSVDIVLTLDGPSHLYNAKVFNEILSGNSSITEFYKINNEIVPNYTGHLLLSLLLWTTTPVLALKILHILYVLGLTVSFRKLVLELNPKGGLISLLIFPFVYSMMFFYGFYNFSIAVIFLFITIRYWIVNYNRKDIKFYFTLFLLFLTTYLSHSFIFVLLCSSVGVYIIVDSINNKDYWKILHLGTKAFLTALPAIVLSLVFILRREPTEYDYRTSAELWDRAFNLSCINKFDEGETFFFIWALIIYLAIAKISRNGSRSKVNDTFLYMSIFSAALYFFTPDGIGYACFLSVRMLYISILFLLIWLSQQEYSKFSIWVVVIGLFVFQFQRVEEMKVWSVAKNNKAKELIKVGKLIPENSIIKPIRNVKLWNYLNISSFLGVYKPQVILNNYEASYDYFPIEWKIELEEKNKIQTNNFFQTSINGKTYFIDYLAVMGEGEIQNESEIEQIKYAEENFIKVYQSYFVTLYKVNKTVNVQE